MFNSQSEHWICNVQKPIKVKFGEQYMSKINQPSYFSTQTRKKAFCKSLSSNKLSYCRQHDSWRRGAGQGWHKATRTRALSFRKLRVSSRSGFSATRRETTIPLSESICCSTLCSFYLFGRIARRGLRQRPSRAPLTPRPALPPLTSTLFALRTIQILI